MFSLEKRRLWCDQMLAFQYLKEPKTKRERDFLQGPGETGHGGNASNLEKVALD